MQRIYLPHTEFGPKLILTQEDIVHQLGRVLRSRVGDSVAFFDGVNPLDAVYTITSLAKERIEGEFLYTRDTTHVTASLNLTLYQALPNKLSKLETILQKATEVGYQKIILFRSEYSQPLSLSPHKHTRLQKIIQEAVEQSGGNRIPTLEILDALPHFDKQEVVYLCDSNQTHTKRLSSLRLSSKDIGILVGPEGGWSEAERDFFHTSGAESVSLGTRILRTETVAPIVGFYVLQL